jgi:hypothetical protein
MIVQLTIGRLMMGTRSIHIFPMVKGRKKCQYLQFDGYPEHQILKFIADSKSILNYHFVPLHDLIDGKLQEVPKSERINDFLEYLDAYYKFRSYESRHSVNMELIIGDFEENAFDETIQRLSVEYIYEWKIDNKGGLNLTVINTSSNKSRVYSIKELNELSEKINIRFDENLAKNHALNEDEDE